MGDSGWRCAVSVTRNQDVKWRKCYNATLTASFESEKLDALTYHMGKKDADLQAELNDTMQKLYEKHVPQATREYIEDRLKREASVKEKPKRPVRPAAHRVEEPQT